MRGRGAGAAYRDRVNGAVLVLNAGSSSLKYRVLDPATEATLVRGIEAEALPVCASYGMGVITWSPLAGGWLSGRWRKGQEKPTSSRAERLPHRFDMSIPGNQRKLDATEQLAQLAEQHGMTLIELALDTLPPPPDEPEEGEEDDPASRPIRLAVAGRPNVGKSTLINTWLGEERLVAFDLPGTTRDAISVPL